MTDHTVGLKSHQPRSNSAGSGVGRGVETGTLNLGTGELLHDLTTVDAINHCPHWGCGAAEEVRPGDFSVVDRRQRWRRCFAWSFPVRLQRQHLAKRYR